MSGEGVKTLSRCLKGIPRGLKTQEGIEQLAGLNTPSAVTDRYLDQHPGGATSVLGDEGATLH
jgi:hypothetical protein